MRLIDFLAKVSFLYLFADSNKAEKSLCCKLPLDTVDTKECTETPIMDEQEKEGYLTSDGLYISPSREAD